jgi:hypothetical protein
MLKHITNASKPYIYLTNRCVECQGELAITQFLQERDLLTPDDNTQTTCKFQHCDRTCLYRSSYCLEHTFSTAMNTGLGSASSKQSATSRAVRMQATRKWGLDKSSKFEAFLERKKRSARILALDLEGDLKARELRQVAITDADTDQVLCNLTIANPDWRSALQKMHKQYKTNYEVFLCRLAIRLNSKRLYSGQRVKMMEAAKIIESLGIKPTDYILVWHSHFHDYSLLRYHLVSAIGEQATARFFPPQSHIIRVNYLFRHNLGSLASLSLERLFRLYFPNHPLVCNHHDAEIDALKLALMARLGEDFCRGNSKIQSEVLAWAMTQSK